MRPQLVTLGAAVIDLAFSLTLVIVSLVVALAYVERVSRNGAASHWRIELAGSSPLLGRSILEMGYWAMIPAARVCIALGIGADAVSWSSLACAVMAGVALAAGRFGVGAALAVVSSVGDGIDGIIARETGTASGAGEVLDASVDRYGELFFLGGIAYHERLDGRTLVLTLVAVAGAMMVSYATAKAEALQVPAPRGAMRRPERAVYLIVGTALVPIVAAIAAGGRLPPWTARVPLIAALAIVGLVGNVSAVRRLRAVASAVRERESRAPTPTT